MRLVFAQLGALRNCESPDVNWRQDVQEREGEGRAQHSSPNMRCSQDEIETRRAKALLRPATTKDSGQEKGGVEVM